MHRHPRGAPDRALEQRAHHLRPLAEGPREGLVEEGEPDGGEDVPENVIADEPVVVLCHPRLNHVAFAEQLGAGGARENEVAREDSLEQQKAEAAAIVLLVEDLPAPTGQ